MLKANNEDTKQNTNMEYGIITSKLKSKYAWNVRTKILE